ncbi:MAG: hypothetical protein AAF721_01960 [Myxococcota bacterium]
MKLSNHHARALSGSFATALSLLAGCQTVDRAGPDDARNLSALFGSSCGDFDLSGNGHLDNLDLVTALQTFGEDEARAFMVAIGQAELMPTADRPWPLACAEEAPACSAIACSMIDAYGDHDGVATLADLETEHAECDSLESCAGDLDMNPGWDIGDEALAQSIAAANTDCAELFETSTCDLPAETRCGDGNDDDHDGYTDCEDLDCLGDAACIAPACDGSICAADDSAITGTGSAQEIVIDVLGNDVFDGPISLELIVDPYAGYAEVIDNEPGYDHPVIVYEPPQYPEDADALNPEVDQPTRVDGLQYTVRDAAGHEASASAVVVLDETNSKGERETDQCGYATGTGNEEMCRWDVRFQSKSVSALFLGGGKASVSFTRKPPPGCDCPFYSVAGSTWTIQGGLSIGYLTIDRTFEDVLLPCEERPIRKGSPIKIGAVGVSTPDIPVSLPEFVGFGAGRHSWFVPLDWVISGAQITLGAAIGGHIDSLRETGTLTPCPE